MPRDTNSQALSRDQPNGLTGVAFQQAADLVDRYPDLGDIELARLVDLYRELSALEVALLMSDSDLASRLNQFMQDHRAKIRTPFREYAALLAIAVMGVALVIWTVFFVA